MGESTDVRTDLYSVGVMLYEMLAGQRPFEGEAVTVIMKHVSAKVPELPVGAANGAGEAVSAILRRLLQKKVEDRFPTAADLLAAIDASQESGIVARPALHGPVGADWRPTRVQLAIAAAVVTVVVVALVALTRNGHANAEKAPLASSASAAQATAAPVALALPPQPSAASADSVASATPLPPPAPAPAPAPARSTAATEPSAQQHRASTPQKSRRTGPGGIYIPPPSQWFK
jgi:serine/threonine protein kinase